MKLPRNFEPKGTNAIKNIFADILSVGAFSWLILVSKKEIEVLKDFIDQIVYGLSDSAKAFIIILFTDIFVGISLNAWLGNFDRKHITTLGTTRKSTVYLLIYCNISSNFRYNI